MNLEQTAAWCHGMGMEKLRLGKPDDLNQAMRFMLAAWALDEATDEQIFDVISRNKKSPLN